MLQLALGAVLPIVVVCAYHWTVFGAPWRTGYSFITNPQFRDGQRTGLLGITSIHSAAMYGLTFGTSRGLFFLAPISLLGVVGLAHRSFARKDGVARMSLVAFAALFFVNASYFVWWGGAAAGPRHLVPVVPFLAFGLTQVLRAKHRPLNWLVRTAGALSILNIAALTLVGIEAPEQGNVLTQFALPNLEAGRISVLSGASNLGHLLGLSTTLAACLIVCWFVFGLAYVLTLLGRRAAAPRAALLARRAALAGAVYPRTRASD